MNFDQAFDQLMIHEGGYVNNPNDPGGETNYGVTVRVARANGYQGEMRDLPKKFASDIAYKLYWQPIKGDELPDSLRYAVFDAAYNSGPAMAIKWLQLALVLPADGVLGSKTQAALSSCNPNSVFIKMLGHRLEFLSNLKIFSAFGRGWSRRISSIMKENNE